MRRLSSLLVLLAAFAAGAATASDRVATCASDRNVRQQLEALMRSQNQQVAAALDRIDGTARRLLALRSYLRAAGSLPERWSWTQAEIDAYRESPEYISLLTEIDAIRARFERDNPGFTLYANTDVRSLDTQIQRWNENPRVGDVASGLYLATCQGKAAKPQALREFLLDWQPDAPPPLAAPGLSQHGRGRAIDFQIERNKTLVAGTDTADIKRVWEEQGWSRKLQAAVMGASRKFQGPLAQPNEPWHYEYRP